VFIIKSEDEIKNIPHHTKYIFTYVPLHEFTMKGTHVIHVLDDPMKMNRPGLSSYVITRGFDKAGLMRWDEPLEDFIKVFEAKQIIISNQSKRYMTLGDVSVVSNTKKVINFAGALVKHIANGLRNVSEEEQKRRLEICNSCPLLLNGECSLCGCPVEEKTKWESEDCPDDPSRWTGEAKKKQALPPAPQTQPAPMSQPRKKKGGCGCGG